MLLLSNYAVLTPGTVTRKLNFILRLLSFFYTCCCRHLRSCFPLFGFSVWINALDGMRTRSRSSRVDREISLSPVKLVKTWHRRHVDFDWSVSVFKNVRDTHVRRHTAENKLLLLMHEHNIKFDRKPINRLRKFNFNYLLSRHEWISNLKSILVLFDVI